MASKRKRNQLDKRELWKQIGRAERKTQREKMRSLKSAARGARTERHETRERTAAECKGARAAARARARSTCDAGAEQYDRARAEAARARGELVDEKLLRRQLRAAARSAKGREQERKRRGPTVAQRRSESDDEVRSSIDADLVPLWELVKRSIKTSPRKSRLETFLEYVEEHPDEALEAQGDPYERAEREMASRAAHANPDGKVERDVRAIIADQDRRDRALGAFVDAHDGRPFTIYLRSIRDVGLVSRDPSKPAQWRLTRFDSGDPTGHSEHKTWRSAAVYAVKDYRGDLSRVTFHNPRKRS